jgi:leucyl aminopeptidase
VAAPGEDLLAPTLPAWVATRAPLSDVLADRDPTDLVLVVGRSADTDPAELAARLDGVGLPGEDLVAAHEPSTAPGVVTGVPLPPGRYAARRLVVVGLGASASDDLRAAGAAAGRATRGLAEVVVSLTAGPDATAGLLAGEALAAYVEGAVLGGWVPPRWTASGVRAGVPAAGRVTLLVASPDDDRELARAVARARATLVARSLALTPSNIKNPGWMARQARTAARRAGLQAQVWTDRELRAEGFGGLLAVGAGSASPPRLVRLDYVPEGGHRTAGTPRVVLVGKGITFDSGGLQVKPPAGMLAMKSDMLGAGIVLAVLAACRDLEVSVRVTGLLALAENAIGAASYRPGDIVTQYGGRTVEIGNTDAEGRIVLADALAYADAELAPDALVDVATLTGAARVALARAMAPVYATDDSLRDDLVEAGRTTGETLWPFPLRDSYRRSLDSDVADLSHFSRGGPGSIVAALFLREFVGTRRWAHLDIAGPGRSDVDTGALSPGATGFGTRLLLRWLEGQG